MKTKLGVDRAYGKDDHLPMKCSVVVIPPTLPPNQTEDMYLLYKLAIKRKPR